MRPDHHYVVCRVLPPLKGRQRVYALPGHHPNVSEALFLTEQIQRVYKGRGAYDIEYLLKEREKQRVPVLEFEVDAGLYQLGDAPRFEQMVGDGEVHYRGLIVPGVKQVRIRPVQIYTRELAAIA